VVDLDNQRMVRAIEHHAERLTTLADRLGAERA
jgi:hypothetical protein